MAYPCFFSETRFANHCVKVYKALHKDYPALVTTLEETQISKAGGDSKEREKANQAAEIKSSLLNKKFALRLSGVCDIYSVFGHAINVLQTVNMLPHEKYDIFMTCVNDLLCMTESVDDHDKCPKVPKPVCQWPTYHNDVKDINSGKYRGIILIGDEKETRRVNITRFLEKQTSDKMPEDVHKLVGKQLIKFLKELHQKLKSNVYDEEDVEMIKNKVLN